MRKPPKLLSIRETANALEKDYGVVYRLVAQGRIPTQLVGARRKIDPTWLPIIRKVADSLRRGRPKKGT